MSFSEESPDGIRSVPRVDEKRCSGCGCCISACRYGATSLVVEGFTKYAIIRPRFCKRCGRCLSACPLGCIAPQ